MFVLTSWKSRPLSAEQASRMMTIWGKVEADMASNAAVERVCWFIYSDGTGGLTVVKANDPDAATALGLETSLALSEFLEFESRIVMDLESAMPAIVGGMERATA